MRRPRSTRKLGIETLETRTVMAASLTASLSSGVLRIEGTASADNIVLTQNSGMIRITGLATTYATSQVNSISITSLAGNDTIRLSGLNVPGAAFTKAITITNSAGSDSVTKLDGSIASLATGSLNLPATTTAAAGTWFDANIRDAALKAVLNSSFADGKLDRNEMINVFRTAASDGTVNSTEFADLQAVARRTALFTTVEYVGVLTSKVVLGDAANVTYQGTTLGNLAAGATGAKLTNLVNKWFLGADRPTATNGSTRFSYTAASGTLFGASGPQYSDVKQGVVGDCYFVGTLAEVALKAPQEIRNMFIVNGDGTYTVRFFNRGVADYVTVDSQLPVDGIGRFVFANMGQSARTTSNVLWVALAEKAYVQMNQSGWTRSLSMGGGQNSYQAIAGGWFSTAVLQISNRTSTTTMFSGGSSGDFNTFKAAFDAGKTIGFASKTSPTSSVVVGSHQYVALSYNASQQTVTLFNPWGLNNGSQYTGTVTLKWSDVAASFSYWDRA